jgi:photosystem II stability/assembly factor-like uncharacterized protein
MRSVYVMISVLILLPTAVLAQWMQTTGPYTGSIYALESEPNGAGGADVYAGESSGVFRSTDGGLAWTRASNGIPSGGVHSLVLFGGDLFAGMWGTGGVYISRDKGGSWTETDSVLARKSVNVIAVVGTNLFAGTNSGLYRSSDSGATWAAAGLGSAQVTCFVGTFGSMTDTTLFAGTSTGVYRSTDFGANWTAANSGLKGTAVWAVAVHGLNLLAGTYAGINLSTDNGNNWTQVSTAPDFRAFAESPDGNGGTILLAGSNQNGLYRSTDDGLTWKEAADSGLTTKALRSLAVHTDPGGHTSIIAGTFNGGLFRSDNLGERWVRVGLAISTPFSFLATDEGLFSGTSASLFFSDDQGDNWTLARSGLANGDIVSLAQSGTLLFAGTASQGMYRSTDKGGSWTFANTGMKLGAIHAIAVKESTLFAATDFGTFLSTNSGTSWTAAKTGLTDTTVLALAAKDSSVFAGTAHGVFVSTDHGMSWDLAGSGLATSRVQCLVVGGSDVVAGTSDAGVYLSTDQGATWGQRQAGLTNVNVQSLAVTSGGDIFAGTAGDGVFLLLKGGSNWSPVNSGLSGGDVRSLAICGGDLYAGASLGGVWRRPLSEIITGAASTRVDVPEGLALYQNFPNPFNPSTTIKFELPKASVVQLSVLDILGREVSVLVNERRNAGVHEVTFDATGLASGVYFYRLATGNFVDTKKFVLLR